MSAGQQLHMPAATAGWTRTPSGFDRRTCQDPTCAALLEAPVKTDMLARCVISHGEAIHIKGTGAGNDQTQNHLSGHGPDAPGCPRQGLGHQIFPCPCRCAAIHVWTEAQRGVAGRTSTQQLKLHGSGNGRSPWCTPHNGSGSAALTQPGILGGGLQTSTPKRKRLFERHLLPRGHGHAQDAAPGRGHQADEVRLGIAGLNTPSKQSLIQVRIEEGHLSTRADITQGHRRNHRQCEHQGQDQATPLKQIHHHLSHIGIRRHFPWGARLQRMSELL